jgi:pre-mRNA-splicing factor SYF2
MAARSYSKLVKNLQPDLENYESQKQALESKLGVVTDSSLNQSSSSITAATNGQNEVAYAALSQSQIRPSDDSISKLVKHVETQIEKRKTFSRRRAHHEDEDVTYINERNMRFNKKIARAFDKHTAEIKVSFQICLSW